MSFQLFQWSLSDGVLSRGAQSKASGGGLPLRIGPTDETSVYKAKVLDDAPVLYYRFNEVAFGAISDESGNGLSGTSDGLVDFSIAGALLDDPNDSFRLKKVVLGQVRRTNNALIDFGNSDPFSVEFWIKPVISINQHDLISKYDSTTVPLIPNGWSIEMPSGTVSIDVVITGTSSATVNFDPTPGIDLSDAAWHHIVMVYDATTPGDVSSVSMWIDGTNIAPAGSGSIPTDMSNAKSLIMGLRDGNNANTTGYFGLMDEVAIYDKALPAEDIIEHYNLGSTGGPFFSRVTFSKLFPDTAYPNGVEVQSVQLPGALGNLQASGDDQRKVRMYYDIGAGEVEIDPTGNVNTGIIVPPSGTLLIHIDMGIDPNYDTQIAPYLAGLVGTDTGPVLLFQDLIVNQTNRVIGEVIS